VFFNSLQYAFFLPLVFTLYWIVSRKSRFSQNLVLLLASYVFYGFWDWRFLFLLAFSTLLDFYTGLRIASAERQVARKFWLLTSIIINVGFLAVFKYFNFFSSSFSALGGIFGLKADPVLLEVILPVGISFYTFHGISYIIDIYYRRIQPTENFLDYSVFVCFFPLLVAGPIERATHLLPQIKQARVFDKIAAVDGLRQILWGLFKKIVIADNCAVLANQVFDHSSEYAGLALFSGAFAFSIQIYCDFSGYSDIALGSARLFNIELLRNFSYPYFSRDMAEFWRKWHISLSSWFRDYLYIPLGGSRVSKPKQMRNVLIVFVVSGFWHGANWTFIIWGLLNGMYILPSLLAGRNRNHLETVAKNRIFPSTKEFFLISGTFLLAVLTWVFFRSENVGKAASFLMSLFSGLLSASSYTASVIFLKENVSFAFLWILVFFISLEWLGREFKHPLSSLENRLSRMPLRWGLYLSLSFVILVYGGKEEQFIYFQF
jgi:alginate O-acetyltransferase complex protein AlgI